MAAIIEASGLTKRYGSSRGIIDLSFQVEQGEVFGFLGPNGAGKTTTIRTLMGFLKPIRGRATIAGLDCWGQSTEVKRVTGYLPADFSLDPSLTGAQIIAYLGNLRGGVDQAYVMSLIERLELDPGKKFREYSHGNKQKVGLIQAFMHRPRLLILDEPTGGLDPLNQQEFYHMIAEARAEGQTAFISSHYLAEIEHTCGRVGIIREGRLVTVDAVHTLKELQHHMVDITFPGPASPDWFGHLADVSDVTVSGDGRGLSFTVRGSLEAVLRAAVAHDAIDLSTREPSLEEIFLRYYTPDSSPIPAGS
jgi:ABC-2 type transport system ATP-binding protein